MYTLFAEGAAIAYTLEQFTGDITSLFESGMDMANAAMNFVVSNPITIAYVGLPLVGLGIGFLRRLINN